MFNTDKPEVAAAQRIMLEMLIEVHKICEQHSIRYWLDAGTLLGAIREGGFIPWDDDLDISMPREDYKRFLKVAQQYLPKDMFLQTTETDKAFPLSFAKIRKLDTELIETGETGEEPYCHGVFIDIFPYDCYKYGWFIKAVEWARKTKDKKNKYKKGSLKRAWITFCNNIFMLIPLQIIKLLKIHAQKHILGLKDDAPFFTFALRDIAPCYTLREDILPPKYQEGAFEGHGFYFPANPDKVLLAAFGSDYMTPPPVEEQKTHAKRIIIDKI